MTLRVIYALYKDEDVLAQGTIEEIANELDIQVDTVKRYGRLGTKDEKSGRYLVEVQRFLEEGENTGTVIQAILDKLGLTQRKFGKLIGVHHGSISEWILGRAKPSRKAIQKMRIVEEVYKAYPDYFDYPEYYKKGSRVKTGQIKLEKRDRSGVLTKEDMDMIRDVEARYGSMGEAPDSDPAVQTLQSKFGKKRAKGLKQ